MIPTVKAWTVNVMSCGKSIVRVEVYAPTKLLAKLNFRHDYPQYWGTPIRVSPSKLRFLDVNPSPYARV